MSSVVRNLFAPLLSVLVSPFWMTINAIARVALRYRQAHFPVPVISVGNIVAGGVGKTEIAAAIAARLAKSGHRVVVASRGYGSEWQNKGAIALDAATAASLKFPDEAQVILTKAPGAMVAVGANRGAVLKRHWEELMPQVVILDDGFQHFGIARDLDILVHDFGVRWPILRDFPGWLDRAGARVSFSAIPGQFRDASGKRPWTTARYKISGTGHGEALPKEALVFCGLGNPFRFRRSLEEAGVKVRGFRTYRDHMQYGEADAKKLAAWKREKGNLPLLTTLKDYVKLKHFVESQGGIGGFEPRWVSIELEFTSDEDLFWNAIEAAVDRRRL